MLSGGPGWSDSTLIDLWRRLPEFRTMVDAIKKGMPEQLAYGLTGSAETLFVAALALEMDHVALVVTADLAGARRFKEEIESWLDPRRVVLFPQLETLAGETAAQSRDLINIRLETLGRLAQGERLVVVSPATALLRRLSPPSAFKTGCIAVRVGECLDLQDVASTMVSSGYERTEMVESPGQFAVRGGLLDVFPPTCHTPVRVELFGQEVESLRQFDPESQRSLCELERVVITPASEFIASHEDLLRGTERAQAELELAVARLRRAGETAAARTLEESVGSQIDRLREADLEAAAGFLPLVHGKAASLVDYLGRRPLVFLSHSSRVRESVEEAERNWRERFEVLQAEGRAIPGQKELFTTWFEVMPARGEVVTIYVESLLRKTPGSNPANIVSFSSRPVPAFHGQWQLFREEMDRWLQKGSRCIVQCSTEERAKRLAEMLGEERRPVLQTTVSLLEERVGEGQVVLTLGAVREGFELAPLRLVVLSDGSIFPRTKLKARRRPAAPGVEISHFTDLNPGDYVVHAHHGIGRYLGMQPLEVRGVTRDYLHIRYAGADRLYVPTDQIDLVQKYIGVEGKEPKVYSLGTGDWNRVKKRVRESVREMASELLSLYAARQEIPGHSFSSDTTWQAEFEDAFPFEETPDQLEATAEIKADMESPRPMDRLLCGDVGYGKTEVALRAAFKAVMEGKQVAVLVPTTILAQQHYYTFKGRFEGFPVVIEVLSRFRTRGEQEAVLTRLLKGSVDIVIGTHRLLQNDVAFKDLGLLIIDEEHRFGVAHKEKLKQLRQNVDVLTLTATPIPRTLHMSLVGLRDVSVIDTPPEDRFPVETFVVEYSDQLVRDAILRELSRGGQVFYVHNRVRSIQYVHRRLARLVPEARIAVAHGQMSEDRLERVMLDFLAGEYDVLLCTTIIESGLDMANVNTLLVENADKMGLAQLYQLRGRVGRSDRIAYAYFTYQKQKVLAGVAEKRLEAIKSFTELGSGFKIALRDLEIRGAGNILGPEQHGFIISVGFDLYCQLLDEAVGELRGLSSPPRIRPVVELSVNAYINEDYIEHPGQRIHIYKKINGIEKASDVAEVRRELEDRFGRVPGPVENLLNLAWLRVLAAELGIFQVTQKRGVVELIFVEAMEELVAASRLLARNYKRGLTVFPGSPPRLSVRTSGRSADEVLGFLLELLGNLKTLQAALQAERSGSLADV